MYEPTREQEAKIAAMALEHGSVAVEVASGTVVKATAGGVSWLVYQDGDVSKAPPERVYLALPITALRSALGDDIVDKALAALPPDDAFPEHTLGKAVEDGVVAALLAPVA